MNVKYINKYTKNKAPHKKTPIATCVVTNIEVDIL